MKDSLKIYKDVPPQNANLLMKLYQPAFKKAVYPSSEDLKNRQRILHSLL